MSEDDREAQSKFDRPAAPASGRTRPAEPEAQTPAVPAAPTEPTASVAPAVPEGAVVSAAPPAQAMPAAPAAPAISVVPAAPTVPSTPPVPTAPTSPSDADDDEDYDEDELPLTFVERLRRLPPAPVILTAGSIGSLLFLARAVSSHTTPVAVLMSSAVVTGLIFGVDTVIASVATWRTSQDGESGRALLLALVGGVAALVTAGAFAGTLIMILVLNS